MVKLWREVAMASEGRFRVDVEALACSAAQVSAQGEDLASAHLSSDNRIAAVESGWVGESAAALHIRTASWLETSRRLLARVGDHALNLTNDSIDLAAMDHANVEKLRAVGDEAAGSRRIGRVMADQDVERPPNRPA